MAAKRDIMAHQMYIDTSELLRDFGRGDPLRLLDGGFNPRLFIDIYSNIHEHGREELAKLMNRFNSVIRAVNQGRLTFTVNDVKREARQEFPWSDATREVFAVQFADNLDGYTTLFVPTHDHATNMLRYIDYNPSVHSEELHEQGGKKDIKGNRIVSSWSYGKFDSTETGNIDIGDIYLYSPESYVENGCFSMYLREDSPQYALDKIIKFKRDLISEFIPHKDSPISYRIRELFNSGRPALQTDKKTDKKSIFDLKGERL